MSNIIFSGNNKGVAVYENYLLFIADGLVKFNDIEYNFPSALYITKYSKTNDIYTFTNLQPIIKYDYSRDGIQQGNLLTIGEDIYITVNVNTQATYLNFSASTENILTPGYYLIYLNNNIYYSMKFSSGFDNIQMVYDNNFIYFYTNFNGFVEINGRTFLTSINNINGLIYKAEQKTLNEIWVKDMTYTVNNLFINQNEFIFYGNQKNNYHKITGEIDKDFSTFTIINYENEKLVDAYYLPNQEITLTIKDEKLFLSFDKTVNYEIICDLSLIYLTDFKINYFNGITVITGCNMNELKIIDINNNCEHSCPSEKYYLFMLTFINKNFCNIQNIPYIFELSEQYSYFNSNLLILLTNFKKYNLENNVLTNFSLNQIIYN